jgi:ribose transport system permease protein
MTAKNILNVLRQSSVTGILACGFGLVFLMGGFDLSMGAILSLSSCLVIGVMKSSGFAEGLAIALAAGLAIGAANGVLINITKGDTSETFLITLGISLVCFSISTTYTNGYNLYYDSNGLETVFASIGQSYVWDIPVPVVLFVALLAIFQVVLKTTLLGRRIYLVGGNKKASFLSGIDVAGIKTLVFSLSGLCAGIAGVVMASRTTAAGPRIGEGYEFDACIAVIAGGMKIGAGKGGMVNVLVGTAILGILTNIMNLTGTDSVFQIMIKALILLLMVSLDSAKLAPSGVPAEKA